MKQVFAINLKASFVAAQEVGKKLLELKRPGKIINIASIISFIANINIAAYACTKGGVLQMTKAFSNEWASKGINVNCICPGYAYVVASGAASRSRTFLTSVTQTDTSRLQ